MRAAAIWPLCCFKAHAESNPTWQQWPRRKNPASHCKFHHDFHQNPGRNVISEAGISVRCNVASSPESIEPVGMEEQTSPTTSSSFSIRAAKLEEVWQIADTHCSTFMPDQGFVMDFALRFDRMLVMLGTLPMDQKKFLVAVEQGHQSFEVSGTLTIDNVGEFLPRRKASGQRRTGIAYVSNLAVRHQRRRKGIARKLLRESEELARSWGCRSIALHCDQSNSAAVALYKAAGFKVINIPRNARWPQPKGLPGSSFLFMMKSLKVYS